MKNSFLFPQDLRQVIQNNLEVENQFFSLIPLCLLKGCTKEVVRNLQETQRLQFDSQGITQNSTSENQREVGVLVEKDNLDSVQVSTVC